MATPTLLIVEDNENEQYALAQLVQKFDYETKVVGSAEEALVAVVTTRFAAILLDVTLPQMDGFECAKRIREMEIPDERHTPIIALTGRATAADRQACLAAGMDDYLSKPFDPEALRRILLRWLYQPNRPNLKVLRPLEQEKCSEP
jgi:CheY-like chemotaxis protein